MRQCWSLYGKDQLQVALELLPQHCSPQAEALSCPGFHHFWDQGVPGVCGRLVLHIHSRPGCHCVF